MMGLLLVFKGDPLKATARVICKCLFKAQGVIFR